MFRGWPDTRVTVSSFLRVHVPMNMEFDGSADRPWSRQQHSRSSSTPTPREFSSRRSRSVGGQVITRRQSVRPEGQTVRRARWALELSIRCL
jgi:hypothetical protein